MKLANDSLERKANTSFYRDVINQNILPSVNDSFSLPSNGVMCKPKSGEIPTSPVVLFHIIPRIVHHGTILHPVTVSTLCKSLLPVN